MNSNFLAKHYNGFTPHERLSLIMAAEERGDETERNRLEQTAPWVMCHASHHFRLTLALHLISNQHYMELLSLAAQYLQAILAPWDDGAEWQERYEENADDFASDEPVFFGLTRDLPFMFGFTIKTLLAGWRLFCEKLQIPPDAPWESLPGYETVRQAEKLTESFAYPEKACAVAFLRHYASAGDESPIKVKEAEQVAAGLERSLQALLGTDDSFTRIP
jgi:hypothetical protein